MAHPRVAKGVLLALEPVRQQVAELTQRHGTPPVPRVPKLVGVGAPRRGGAKDELRGGEAWLVARQLLRREPAAGDAPAGEACGL